MTDETPAAVTVENVERVDVGMTAQHMPYAAYIAIFSAVLILCFAIVTWLVLKGEITNGVGPETKGALIQTWNNLALMAATFWVGSSLGGKMQAKPPTG